MLYYLYVAGFSLAKMLPLRACYGIAEVVARLYFLFAKKDKEGLRNNLRVVLGDDTDEALIDTHIMSVFRNFAKYLADFFKATKFTKEYMPEHIDYKEVERLEEALAGGKGVVLVALHLGNWELGGAILAGLGFPMNAIALEHSNKKINDFFVSQRAINGLKSIPIGLQIRECYKAIKRNEALAIVGDKDYTSNGIYVDFFGRKALLPKGPAVIALKTGAPVVFVAVVRNPDDSFKVVTEEAIRYTPTGDFDKDVICLMKEYIGIFEKYIRKYPDQWYVFEDIWKQE